MCTQLTPHLLALRDAGPDNISAFPGWSDCLERAGGYFYGRGAYPQAAPLARDILAIREKVLGPEHPKTATSLVNFAMVLAEEGDFATARALLDRALAIREKVLGPEHTDTASALQSLAWVRQRQSDLAGARPLYERALAIFEKTLGSDHPDTARGLHNLAYMLMEQGDLAGARPLVERSFAILEKAFGPEHSMWRVVFTVARRCFGWRAILQGRRRSSSAGSRFTRRLMGMSIPLCQLFSAT
jgi:tetratricopeptide (TPR) repeat protein